jgi:hypothetical protein
MRLLVELYESLSDSLEPNLLILTRVFYSNKSVDCQVLILGWRDAKAIADYFILWAFVA